MTQRRYLAVLLLLTAVVARAEDPVRLESTLDEVLHGTGLLAVGGVKPIAAIGREQWRGDRAKMAAAAREHYAILSAAVRNGKITNPDLRFIFHPQISPSEPDSSAISVVNLRALQRVLDDKEAMEVLKRAGYRKPDSVEQLLTLYRVAVEKGGFLYESTAGLNTIVGLCLGYPPSEVELYAAKKPSLEAKSRGVQAPLLPGYHSMGGYTRYSEEGFHRDIAYLEGATHLMQNHAKLLAEGRTNLELINDPGLLATGSPCGASVYALGIKASWP